MVASVKRTLSGWLMHYTVARNATPAKGKTVALRSPAVADSSPRFTVTDGGAEFDTARTRHGTGLQGMAIGWPRSAAPSTSAHSPGTEPP
jgi:hypothetical protein